MRNYGFFCFFGMLSLCACVAPPLGEVCSEKIERQCGETHTSYCFAAASEQTVDTYWKRDNDILFVIDSSRSMAPKQAQLARLFEELMRQIEATRDVYHVGVITTDLSDDGMLQNASCSSRTQSSSSDFAAACPAECATVTLPAQRYLTNEEGIRNVPDPIAAFKCMALVGDGNRGVSSPLEAMKRALDGHRTENAEFLRDWAALSIYFITDQDDCSVLPAKRDKLNPYSMDCGTASPDLDPSCYNQSYRCTAASVICNEPLNTVGAKTGCQERASFLSPLDDYARFLTRLRPADKLALGGIWPPSMLDFESRISTPFGSGQLITRSYDTASPPSQATNLLARGVRSEAACNNSDPTLTNNPEGYFGQAQLRLSLFKSKFDPTIWSEHSICDPKSYPNVLNKIAYKLIKHVGVDCLGVLPNRDCNGQPLCLVGFVDRNNARGLPDRYLPACSATCCAGWADSPQPYGSWLDNREEILDPRITAACAAEAEDCYCAVESKHGLCFTTALAGLWRKDNRELPPGKVTTYRCAGTRPPSPQDW